MPVKEQVERYKRKKRNRFKDSDVKRPMLKQKLRNEKNRQ